jgi:hypothetical protein
LSIEDISKETNIPSRQLQAVKNGDLVIDFHLGAHLARSYPDLNYGWVQTGEGNMLLDAKEIDEQRELREFVEGKQLRVVHSSYLTEIRKLNDKFLIVAPFVGEFDMQEYVENWGTKFYPEISEFSVCVDSLTLGNYLSLFVYDDSMNDGSSSSFPHKSIVTGKQIEHLQWTNKSVLNRYKIFIIHTKDTILLRRVIKHDPTNNMFQCEALNPDKSAFPNIEIDANEVREMFNIEVTTRFNQ